MAKSDAGGMLSESKFLMLPARTRGESDMMPSDEGEKINGRLSQLLFMREFVQRVFFPRIVVLAVWELWGTTVQKLAQCAALTLLFTIDDEIASKHESFLAGWVVKSSFR
jgi:hypothetical protein